MPQLVKTTKQSSEKPALTGPARQWVVKFRDGESETVDASHVRVNVYGAVVFNRTESNGEAINVRVLAPGTYADIKIVD